MQEVLYMLFRIEDISGFEPQSRTYDLNECNVPIIEKGKIDQYISGKIRAEINNSQTRDLLSYSKSLATCLLKYNNFTDNELHIYDTSEYDYFVYLSSKGKPKCKNYSIEDRLSGKPLFNKSGNINLCHFIIDVSDNEILNEYLIKYQKIEKKRFASPEKDQEVVVMNPLSDLVITDYMDAVYILYALQLKYRFLNNSNIRTALISEIEEIQFDPEETDTPEKTAFIELINYLANYWEEEYKLSQIILNESENTEHLSMAFDSILQFDDIMKHSFEDSYNLSTYNQNKISDLFWKFCREAICY